MDDEELRELQNPANWDDEGYVIQPAANPGVRLTVRFSLPEFERVSREAKARNIKTTDFVRVLALKETAQQGDDLAARRLRRPA